MGESGYIHGYSQEEHQRLNDQAAYWARRGVFRGLDYRAGERLLEIGCAGGATLAALAREYPGLQIAGIDREPAQIEFARRTLRNVPDADLRVGAAEELPWGDETFDHVFVMWLVEHLKDPRPMVQEARRVLKTGGTITVIETDYASLQVYPESDDYAYLRSAQHDLFARAGTPAAGRTLGPLLLGAGFHKVTNDLLGFHFFSEPLERELRRHVDYVARFMEPMIERMVADLGRDREPLRRGLAYLRGIPDYPSGAMTQLVYRARGVR